MMYELREIPDDVVEHVVVDSDTLAGLRLRYGVSVSDLRRLNSFPGNSFRTCRVLRIPRKKSGACQTETNEVKTQRVRNATRLGKDEAENYLECAEWNVDEAVAAASCDLARSSKAAVEKTAEVNAIVAPLAESMVVVHLASARGLRDAGIVSEMDVYVVVSYVEGKRVVARATSASVPAPWSWSPSQSGSSLQFPYSGGDDVSLIFTVFAPHDLMPDTLVGRTNRVSLRRFVDGALHSVSVDTGGELTLSILAPRSIERDAVRAVASEPNPFFCAGDSSATATVSPSSVTAVAVTIEGDADNEEYPDFLLENGCS